LIEDLLAPIFDSDRKAERLGKVLSGVRQMCLSGKHDEASFEGRPIPIDHNDAVLAFLMTSAAISYLEQLPLLEQAQVGASGTRSRSRRRSRRPRAEGLAPAIGAVEAKPAEPAAMPPAPSSEAAPPK